MAGLAGNTMQGALGGASLGTAIAPGIGTAIGAGGGALLGALGSYFGGDKSDPYQGRYDAFGREVQRRGAGPDANMSGFRNMQADYLRQVRALAQGSGPSLATEMLRGQNQAIALNQNAMAAGARGNGALAARNAMNNAAGQMGTAAGQASMARAQEQLGALQQWGYGTYGARNQDEEMNRFNAAQAARNMQWNDQMRLAALAGGAGRGDALAAQPGWGDYLMNAGGALGQMYSMAKAKPPGTPAQAQQAAANVGQGVQAQQAAANVGQGVQAAWSGLSW